MEFGLRTGDREALVAFLATDGAPTVVPGLFDGNASRRFEAVWHDFHSLDTMPEQSGGGGCIDITNREGNHSCR